MTKTIIILLILSLGIALSACVNIKKTTEPKAVELVKKSSWFKSDSSFTVNDTVFLYRDEIEGTSQSVFFDENPNSQFYDVITATKSDLSDNESYQYSMNYLKENNLKLIKKKPIIPYTKWSVLKQYKGKFYAYKVCDNYHAYRISINDSTYIDWTGEGPDGNQIAAQKKIDDNTYEYLLNGVMYNERTMRIHIIDNEKGIAVFENVSNEFNENNFFLMIASDKVRTVPIIVNNCKTAKQREVNFEVPDYQALLKMKGGK
jgi:hypothetical protein